MNSRILTILLLFFTAFSFAQEDLAELVATANTSKDVDVGISIYPHLSMPTIVNPVKPYRGTTSNYLKSKTGFSLSAFLEFFPQNKNHSIASSIGYHSIGKRTIDFVAQETDFSISNDTTVEQFSQKVTYHNIEVAVNFKYYIDKAGLLSKKANYLLLGFSGLIHGYIAESNSFTFEDGNTGTEKTFEPYQASKVNAMINFGYGHNFRKKKYTIFLQPYAQFMLLGTESSIPLSNRFLSIGVATGFKI